MIVQNEIFHYNLLNSLLEFTRSFNRITEINVILVDFEGKIIYLPEDRSSSCNLINHNSSENAKCNKSLDTLIKKCLKNRDVVSVRCKAGIPMFAVPVLKDEKICGYLVTCGKFIKEAPRFPDEMDNDPIGWVTKEYYLNCIEHLKLVVKSIVNCYDCINNEQNIYKLTQNQIELENNLAQMEVRNLENQLKPHFLFNTLNLIARLILLKHSEEALETVYALSKMLRYARDQKELVRLRDEVHYLKNYLFIQKCRFNEQLEFRLDISQNILGSIVPTLCLQPLIENAIKHGLDPKGGGTIEIYGRLIGEEVVLKVTDDGVGFKPNVLNDFSNFETSGTGLMNLEKRIKYYYGDEYGLTVDSKPQNGAEVKVVLPFKSDIEDKFIPVFWFDK